MTENIPANWERILVIHPDRPRADELASVLKKVLPKLGRVDHLPAPGLLGEWVQLHPDALVLLDLDHQTDAALDATRAVRGQVAGVIGLHRPLSTGDDESQLLRRALRAGIQDLVPINASEGELGEALTNLSSARAAVTSGRTSGGVVSFHAVKGGLGTTTLAFNAAALYAAEHPGNGDVVLVDADLPWGDARDFLDEQAAFDLAHFIREMDEGFPPRAYAAEETRSGLRVIGAPESPTQALALGHQDLARALQALRRQSALTVVDTPSTLDLYTLGLFDLSARIFLVAEAISPSLRRTARLQELLLAEGYPQERIRVVVNRFGTHDGEWSKRDMAELLGQDPLAYLPLESRASEARDRGQPLVQLRPKCEFTRNLHTVVEEMASAAAAPTG